MITKMDDYYCVINLICDQNIVLYIFEKQKTTLYPICLISFNSNKIFHLISIHNSFINFSLVHYLYLGKELYKAEISLKFGQQYIQN